MSHEPGTLVATRESAGASWHELLLLRPSPGGDLSYVAATPRRELKGVDLNESYEHVVGDEEFVRPILELEASGEAIADAFDDLPSADELAALVGQVDEWLAESDTRDPMLRGGASRGVPWSAAERAAHGLVPVPAPPRLRITSKTAAAATGYGGTGGGVDGSSGLGALRDSLGGRVARHDGDVLAPGGVWLVADTRILGLKIGEGHQLTPRAVVLGNLALDYTPSGVPTQFEYVMPAFLNGFEAAKIEEMKLYLGLVTPRDKAAGGTPGLGALGAQLDVEKKAGDARVLPIERASHGERFRDFRSYFESAHEPEIPGWPLKGPRSAKWVLQFCLNQTGAGPVSRVNQFMQLGRLQFSDGNMTEYSVLAKVLELAQQFDQLNVGGLASTELICRRMQLIEEKFRHRLPQIDGGKTFDVEGDSALFLGLGAASSFGRSAVMVMPELSEYIGEELSKEAAVSKGKVKAHELRQQMQKLRGGVGGPKAGGAAPQ